MQIYYNDQWVDWKPGNMQTVYLYNNGDECTDVTGGYSSNSWTIGSIKATDPTFTNNSVTLDTNGVATVKNLATVNMIDLTDVNMVHFGIHTTKGGNGIFYGYSNNKTISDLSPFKKASVVTSDYQEYTVDVSDLIGKYYILAFVYGDSGAGYVNKIWIN